MLKEKKVTGKKKLKEEEKQNDNPEMPIECN